MSFINQLLRTLIRALEVLTQKDDNIMAAIDDLNANVAALHTTVADSVAHMDKLFADLTAALATNNEAAVAAAATAIQGEIDVLKAAVAKDA